MERNLFVLSAEAVEVLKANGVAYESTNAFRELCLCEADSYVNDDIVGDEDVAAYLEALTEEESDALVLQLAYVLEKYSENWLSDERYSSMEYYITDNLIKG